MLWPQTSQMNGTRHDVTGQTRSPGFGQPPLVGVDAISRDSREHAGPRSPDRSHAEVPFGALSRSWVRVILAGARSGVSRMECGDVPVYCVRRPSPVRVKTTALWILPSAADVGEAGTFDESSRGGIVVPGDDEEVVDARFRG